MNILFISLHIPNGINGGAERVISGLAGGLRQKGFTVYTLSFDDPAVDMHQHFCVPQGSTQKDTIVYISGIMEKYAIDTVILNETGYRMLALFRALRKCDSRLITGASRLLIESHHIIADFSYVLRWCVYSLKNSPWTTRLLKMVFFVPFVLLALLRSYLVYYLFVSMSDTCIVLSSAFIPDLKKKCFFMKIDDTKLVVVNNPLSFPIEGIRTDIKENIVLFVGRLDDYDKNIFEVVHIWEKATRDTQFSTWKLIIIGDGPDKQRMEKLAEKKKLTNIIFMGKQNPVAWYKKAKILMLTSREGWGLVLTEAMQFKAIPVAYSSYSSVVDIIKDGQTGYLVKKSDRKLYAEKLSWIMENWNDLSDVRENGYQYVQKFSLDKIVDEWGNMLLRINK